MAITSFGDDAKYRILLNGFKNEFDRVTLVNSLGAGATDAPIIVASTGWTVSGTTVYNTNTLVFDCSAGMKPYSAVVYISSFGVSSEIVITLTDVPVGGYDFTTTGTFTIPAGDLVIGLSF